MKHKLFMSDKEKKVVTRFAPSPTGFVHIGGIRTALFAYLLARKNGGDFILRIEDTDRSRVVEGSLEHIQESLKWLGLDWDYGPDKPGPFGSTIQSERLDTYMPWAQKLIEKGLAYPDPYTAEEVESFRQKAQEEKKPFLYRDHRPKTFGVWDGKTALRYKVPEIKRYEWIDEVRGELSAGPEALDDIVIIKADGYPVYAFAHIIDDYNMGITHILRSDEWIASVPRFLSLYESLGIKPPLQATLPPILRDDRTKKLGKRDGAKDVLDYKKEGYLPEALLNYLALIGWNPGTEQELFTLDELVNVFSLDRIQKAGGAFNEEKLDWINKEHLKKLSYEEQEEYIAQFLPNNIKNLKGYSNTIVHNITQVVMERISKGTDIVKMAEDGELSYFFEEPVYKRESLFFKNSKIANNKERTLISYLQKAISLIETIGVENFTKEKIKDTLWPYAEEVGRGDILWPMRYALSGLDKSPDPFVLSEILGKEETIKRLNKAISTLG
jgi:glutamyl-tRNA synthetase